MASPAEDIRDWLKTNRKAPAHWRLVAQRLLDYHDADAMWQAIGPLLGPVEGGVPVLSAATRAWEAAAAELSLPETRSGHGAALKRVAAKIDELREAILQAGFRPGHEHLTDFKLQGNAGSRAAIVHPDSALPDANLWFAWHGVDQTRNDRAIPGYGVNFVDMLDLAGAQLRAQTDALPFRSVRRVSKTPRAVAAMVHWLAFHAHAEIPGQRDAAIAHITTALLELADPLGADEVRAVLKTTTPELKRGTRLR